MWSVISEQTLSRIENPQNLARQYAAKFGQSDVEYPDVHHTLESTDSLLVTSTHNLDNNKTAEDNEKMQSEPRGFFADQFEVYLLKPIPADIHTNAIH